MRILPAFASLFLCSVACAAIGAAQDAGEIKARYTKTEYQVAMRDGKRLVTVVYAPSDTTRS